MIANDIPEWFSDVVASGLQALVVLSLPAQPPAETIALTLDVWVRTLWQASIDWTEQLDKARIERAFAHVARRADRWPAPKHLLDALPARPTQPALPVGAMTEEKRARARVQIAEVARRIGRRMGER